MSGALKGTGAGSSPTQTGGGDDGEGGFEVSPFVADAVGKALQAHFQAIAEMPLPDRLLVLLAELEARERKQS